DAEPDGDTTGWTHRDHFEAVAVNGGHGGASFPRCRRGAFTAPVTVWCGQARLIGRRPVVSMTSRSPVRSIDANTIQQGDGSDTTPTSTSSQTIASLISVSTARAATKQLLPAGIVIVTGSASITSRPH